MSEAHPLKQYRTENGLTLADLAERAKTSEASLSRIETGKQAPSLGMLAKLKAATGLTADVFLREAAQ